jgi:hypothetical protein
MKTPRASLYNTANFCLSLTPQGARPSRPAQIHKSVAQTLPKPLKKTHIVNMPAKPMLNLNAGALRNHLSQINPKHPQPSNPHRPG